MVAGVLAGLLRLSLSGRWGARVNPSPQMGCDHDPVGQDSQDDHRHEDYQSYAESFRKLCRHGVASINAASHCLGRRRSHDIGSGQGFEPCTVQRTAARQMIAL